jgi:uncharacterized RDD family membrane protein YckC
MESSHRHATIGKMLCGLVVTDVTGRKISFGRACGRYVAKIVSALLLCIGFLMIAFSERKQALHDLMAETVVVHR